MGKRTTASGDSWHAHRDMTVKKINAAGMADPMEQDVVMPLVRASGRFPQASPQKRTRHT